MKKIRWGIVGPGCIANKFAAAVSNVEEATLVAVASREKVRGEAFAEKYRIPYVFDSYESMANSNAVDAVYIATPHPFHLPCAELFLNAGKHVLCEKPLCVNAAQAERLKACAQKNNVFLMEAMWTVFLPAILEIKRLVSEGAIGDVLGIRADFCYAQAPEEEPKLYQNHMAGGSLLDVGVYGLHFAALFLGDAPQEMHASAQVADGVDCNCTALLHYKNGATATVSSAINLNKPQEAWIYGSNGSIEVPMFYGACEFVLHREETSERVALPSVGDGFEEEIYEACRCISGGKTESERHPLARTIAVLKQMDAIRAEIGVTYPGEK